MVRMRRSPPAPRLPDSKISATILDFAAPMLLLSRRGATVEDYRRMPAVPIHIWNAVAFETWSGARGLVDGASGEPGALPAVARFSLDHWIHLLTRRRHAPPFADDGRVVTAWEVRPDPVDTFRLWAEARSVLSLHESMRPQ